MNIIRKSQRFGTVSAAKKRSQIVKGESCVPCAFFTSNILISGESG
jgi:hypothetical protein